MTFKWRQAAEIAHKGTQLNVKSQFLRDIPEVLVVAAPEPSNLNIEAYMTPDIKENVNN